MLYELKSVRTCTGNKDKEFSPIKINQGKEG